ncbi:cytochrome P450 [Mycena floridula]|nr:cytochrome P450 [Mycena floridula]
MPVSSRLVLSAAVVPLTLVVWKSCAYLYRSFTSPNRRLRGPPADSWIIGNVLDIINFKQSDSEVMQAFERWTSKYGTTISYPALFCWPQLLTIDPKALSHILTNPTIYPKEPAERKQWKLMLGGMGLLAAEGDQHRNQRRILNPAFGPAQMRELTPVFFAKSLQLRDILLSEVTKLNEKTGTIDIHPWLNRAALDMIGLAGFNYDFDTLNPDRPPNEINMAVSALLTAGNGQKLGDIIHHLVPWTRIIETEADRIMAKSKKTIQSFGMTLIDQARSAADGEGVDQRPARDILSLLVRANAAEIHGHQKLDDQQMLAQTPTFLLAGHETTSAAVSLILYALSSHMDVQSKLREELLAVDSDSPSMDVLNALPYLDAVIKETMRFHSPVVTLIRSVAQDDVLPLSDGVLDRYGKPITELLVRKGNVLLVPLLAVNRSQDLWGDDAASFRPERWYDIPSATSAIPSLWNHLMTFSAGPQSCIGYRFAITEMKTMIFTLIRAFEIELGVPAENIVKKPGIAQRPMVKGASSSQPAELPLKLRPLVT